MLGQARRLSYKSEQIVTIAGCGYDATPREHPVQSRLTLEIATDRSRPRSLEWPQSLTLLGDTPRQQITSGGPDVRGPIRNAKRLEKRDSSTPGSGSKRVVSGSKPGEFGRIQ